ncbi:hypothetical protein [Tessaracoccus palaemonis]|uniref:Uncharacterized protein n=1 Tax=Tessaracoccus palaemonis TaxID=2829499 RepID=A0ABX8SI33_9ACTN|nr:hypothetical protein [Tessaracoccus palaemonis]QXT63046.1 hypothetical protein KDB89_00715 [Tessaracoccus palaemonis]
MALSYHAAFDSYDLGPLIGLAAGTLAGIYPALRASRLEPVDALRS